jgi:hypothetical protein
VPLRGEPWSFIGCAEKRGMRMFIGCAEKAGHTMSFLSAYFVFAAPKFASLKELSYICSRKR